MQLNYQKLMAWPFPVVTREYGPDDAAAFARGFGAGLGGALRQADEAFLREADREALPMIAVPLADGEFWQQNPETGIDWQQIVHAEEVLTLHRPVPVAGVVVISQRIEEIYDRGAERGAVMHQKQFLHERDGTPLATIDVTTVLKGNGGFGGNPYSSTRPGMPEERVPDAVIELMTPSERDAIFRLGGGLKVAADVPQGKSMMRGVGCFGTAGRGVLELVCGSRPERLKRIGVRYAGPMYTDERMRIELWRVHEARAVFRMSAPERGALVLNHCFVEFAA